MLPLLKDRLVYVWEPRVRYDAKFTLTEALNYVQTAVDMIVDHLKHDFELHTSVVSLNSVLNLVATEVDEEMEKKDDIFPFVDDYADALSLVITILQMKGCAVGQTKNCTINSKAVNPVLDNISNNSKHCFIYKW
ncbi:uncharacterized protein LOC144622161 [Crassostrea virginica]